MKVDVISSQKFNKNNVNFEAARLNILAQSDSHGMMLNTPQTELAIKKNGKEIFETHDHYDKSKVMNPDSVVNTYIHGGDFSINQGKKGYLTDPEACSGDLQIKFTEAIANIAKDTAKEISEKSPFYAIRALGNHDFDDGDKYIMDKVSKDTIFTTILTNVHFLKSPLLNKYLQARNPHIVTSKIIEIPDDKNDKLINKVLFLGVTIPTMKFYNPDLLEKMQFLDDCDKKDAKIQKKDLTNTIHEIQKRVEYFKDKYPQGAVVMISHTGNILSDMIREEVPQINLILNGHDHKSIVGHEGKTAIHSLGKDNTILKSFNLYFNDEGNLVRSNEDIFVTEKYKDPAKTKNTITNKMLMSLLAKDMVPDNSILTYKPDEKNQYPELKYNEEQIRASNSPLANCLTTRIANTSRVLLEKEHMLTHKSQLISVGVQSSSIRAGLKPSMSNLDLMKIFDGVSERLAGLSLGDVSGAQLVELIRENVADNIKSPTRNALIQWSDIKIDRALINNIINGESDLSYDKAVQVRNYNTKEWEPVDLEKKYVLLLPNKYLCKTDIKSPSEIRGNFIKTNYTMDTLFRKSLQADKIIMVDGEPTKVKDNVIDINESILEARIL